jgi:hypothetical protein
MYHKYKLVKRAASGFLLIALMIVSAMESLAQKSAVLDAFARYDLNPDMLEAKNLELPDDLSFELKEATITTEKTDVIMASFDYKKPKTEQWTVISVNGESPSKSKTRSFRKNHDRGDRSILYDETYKIEKESPEYLVISYKQHPSSNSDDAAYMKDCRLYMTVNLKTKLLEQVQVKNEKPIRIKVIITAEIFDLVTKYAWDERFGRYTTVNRTLNLTADVLGQRAFVQTISDYSNFSK